MSTIEDYWANKVKVAKITKSNLQDELEYLEDNIDGGNISSFIGLDDTPNVYNASKILNSNQSSIGFSSYNIELLANISINMNNISSNDVDIDNLSSLQDDYLLLDGTSAMAGNLDINENDIFDVRKIKSPTTANLELWQGANKVFNIGNGFAELFGLLLVDTIEEKTVGHDVVFNDPIKIDVIGEKTGAAGVTIDGCIIKDNFAKSRIADISDIPGTIANILTNHNKTVHDVLNINADTVDDKHLADLLEVAAGDFNAFTEKGTPVNADIVLIEDSAASYVKKKVQVGNLPGGGSTTWLALTDTPGVFDNGKIIKSGATALSFGMLESDIFKKDGSVAATGTCYFNEHIYFGASKTIRRNADDGFIYLQGGNNNPARIKLHGQDAGNAGYIIFDVPNAAKSGSVTAITIAGVTDTPKLSLENALITDTIEEKTVTAGVTIDSCLIKDGKAANSDKLEGSTKSEVQTHAPASHGADKHTDRTRNKWISCTYAEDGMTARDDSPVGILTDGATKQAYGSLHVPENFVSDGVIKAIIISIASGNLMYTIHSQFAANGENYNNHNLGTGTITEAVILNKLEVLNTSLSLTNLAKGDNIGINFKRWGGQAGDTVDAIVHFVGFIFEYTADQ